MLDIGTIRDWFAEDLVNGRFVTDKSGVRCLEIVGASFFADEPSIFGKPNLGYIQRELAWYESQSLNVYDIPGGPPEIWKQVADKEGTIVSNYGWCVWSEANGNQWDRVLDELRAKPDSRRAVMIYTRPEMWEDYNYNGRSDFMCVSGNMFVKSPEGNIPIKDLVERLSKGERYPVLSVNFSTGERELAWAIRGEKTGVKRTIRVHTDSGIYIDVTEDHKIYVRKRDINGRSFTYENEVEAKDLKVGDSLITSMIYKNGNGLCYKRTLTGNFSYDKRVLCHRDYFQFRSGKEIPEAHHIHHKNENPYDNTFANLQMLSCSEHNRHHMAGAANSVHKIKDRPAQLSKMIESLKKTTSARSIEDYERLGGITLDNARYTLLSAWEQLEKRSLRNLRKEVRRQGLQKYWTILSRAAKIEGRSKEEVLHDNCRVTTIEILNEEDVYDIEVEGNHNYFISSSSDPLVQGVLVHNCTNTVQYLVRGGALQAVVQMRSNDVTFGYRNDYAWQRAVQTRLADELEVSLGGMIWNAGSLHVYERHFYLVDHYIQTGETHVSLKDYRELYPDSEWGRPRER